MKNAAKVLVPVLMVTAVGFACAPLYTNGGMAPGIQAPVSAQGRTTGPVTVIAGAGDIAYDGPGAEATAKLLDRIPGLVFNLGDNAYQSGSREEFERFYAPAWGRHLSRTWPVVGNHEYRTPGAAGYFEYFGPRAGDPRKGYYSYDVNPAWHVVVINSATTGDDASKDLGPDSAQYRWLAEDLDAHRGQNVIAMWHHPRYSSGVHGDNKETDAIWRLLHEKGADITLWGHDHHYERFHPMNGLGERDDDDGMRAFVVGTGGKNHYRFFKLAKRTTAVRDDKTFGVLQLTLQERSYDWAFIPEAGKTFTDSGHSAVR